MSSVCWRPLLAPPVGAPALHIGHSQAQFVKCSGTDRDGNCPLPYIKALLIHSFLTSHLPPSRHRYMINSTPELNNLL